VVVSVVFSQILPCGINTDFSSLCTEDMLTQFCNKYNLSGAVHLDPVFLMQVLTSACISERKSINHIKAVDRWRELEYSVVEINAHTMQNNLRLLGLCLQTEEA